ncbi:MAG: TrkA family potassium uptake protein [Clostridiales bacterium]|jgi:trk system potassium uptake protein TrkA|nr:TrkA family potassium uptake protein [Clostridiales bacterium]
MKNALVIGLGRFGLSLAEELCRHGVEVMGVDQDGEIVKHAVNTLTHAVVANGAEEDVLKALGVADFDCVVVGMADEINDNMLMTIMLKELGAKFVVVKAQSALHMKVLKKLGADMIIRPEYDIGKRVAQKLVSNSIIDYIELSEEYSIAEINAPKHWYNKTLNQLGIRKNYGVNIIAVRNGDKITISPGAAYVVDEKDILVIVASNDDIDRLK